MNYREFLKTSSKTAVDEYKKLQNENAKLAGQLADLSRGARWNDTALNEENHALKLKIDALETVARDLRLSENHNSLLQQMVDDKNEEIEELEAKHTYDTGRIIGLESAIRIITMEVAKWIKKSN